MPLHEDFANPDHGSEGSDLPVEMSYQQAVLNNDTRTPTASERTETPSESIMEIMNQHRQLHGDGEEEENTVPSSLFRVC